MDAAIAIFATGDGQDPVRPCLDIHRLFKRGELAAISREALKESPRNTRVDAYAAAAWRPGATSAEPHFSSHQFDEWDINGPPKMASTGQD